MSSRVDMTVVVGSATVLASNDVPQVMARAVPLSVMSMRRVSPSTGVPERLDVIEVMAWASPVMWATSVLSVLITGVADCVTAGARFVTRLFVSVFVEDMLGMTTPSTASTPAAERESVVSDAFPSSMVVICGADDHAGAVPVPAEERTCPIATAATRPYAVVEVAVRMSPIACDAIVRLLPSFAASVLEAEGNVNTFAPLPVSVMSAPVIVSLRAVVPPATS